MKQSPERFTPEMTGDIRHEHQHRYALAGEFVAGKDVLDIASGEGYGAVYLARHAKSVIGVDIDQEAIDHSRRRYAGLKNVEFRTGSCAAIPLNDHSVDVVTSFETLEHHAEHTEMMREIKRVLRPDGVLLISSPNRPVYSEEPNFVNPFHVKELDYREFAELVEAHFRFVQIFGQKIAAGSLVFPLSDSAEDSFAAYADNGDRVDRLVPPLNAPVYFIAVCSDVRCEQAAVLSSVYLDTHEELLQATRAELSLLRATHLQELSEIETLNRHLRSIEAENNALAHDREALGRALAEVRSSTSFQFVSKVVWRISKRIPRVLRSPLKHLLKKKRALRPNESRAQNYSAGESKLQWSIDTDLSQPLVVGKGNILYLKGWCYHHDSELSTLDIVVDGVANPVSNHSLCEPRMFNKTIDIEDHSGQSLTSTFWTALEFAELETSRELPIGLRATLNNGEVVESEIGTITAVPFLPSPKADGTHDSGRQHASGVRTLKQANEPLIAICLATYNPPIDLLTKQIDSLIAQTHRNWLCIISDDGSAPEVFDEIRRVTGRDPRLQVFQNQTRLGFLQNFECCLNMIPPGVEYVAFCDQDDEWYADKLETSLRAFDSNTQLVFSDMKIVTRDGETISETYWSNRRNNFTDLGTLLLANTVTGASMLFRQELLKDALPFPQTAGQLFHDHWIACVALSKGSIKYVDRPLYVYRQHGSNVHGHLVGASAGAKDVLRSVLALRLSLMGDAIDLPSHVDSATRTYFDYAVRVLTIAKVIKLRRIARDKRKQRVIDHFAKMETSLAALSREVLRVWLHHAPTIGQEFVWLRAVLSLRLLRRHVRQNRARLVAGRQAESLACQPRIDATPTVDFIPQKIAPLKLAISSSQRRRVNILVSEVNFQYLFAGYVCVFNLALELKRTGYEVRIVLVDECDFRPAEWNRQLEGYEGLAGLFDRVEVAYVFDRSNSLSVSPHDAFIATSWWTAHVAHHAVRDLKQERFVYLVQEYEPLFYPAGSFYALATQSYTFTHLAVFSTELLRDHFQLNKLGVFAEDAQGLEPVVLQNAANRFEISEAAIRARKRKRLLFYARPDQRYTARNVFELGVLALRQAIQAGYFQSHDWEFHGLGAVGNYRDVPLDKQTDLIMLPKLGLQEFVKVLPTYDLGLTLMLSPHPSLMPMDMAAAGLVTVTNTFATKTRERMGAISSNIIAVAPTLDGLTQGLATAVGEVDNFEKRIAGTKLNWSTSWAETFSPEVMKRLRAYLDYSAEVSGEPADAFLTATTIS